MSASILRNGINKTKKGSINIDVDTDGDRRDRQNSDKKHIHQVNVDSQSHTRSRKESTSTKYRGRKSSFSSTESSDSELAPISPHSRISTRTILDLLLHSHLKTVSSLKTQFSEIQSYSGRSRPSQPESNSNTRTHPSSHSHPLTQPAAFNDPANSGNSSNQASSMESILLSRLKLLSSEKDSTERELHRVKTELGLYKEGYGRAQGMLVDANEYIREVEDERDELIDEVETYKRKIKRVVRGLEIGINYDNRVAAGIGGGRISADDSNLYRGGDVVAKVDQAIPGEQQWIPQSQAISNTELVPYHNNDDSVQRPTSRSTESHSISESTPSFQINQTRAVTPKPQLPSISQVLTKTRPITPSNVTSSTSIAQKRDRYSGDSVIGTRAAAHDASRGSGDNSGDQLALIRFPVRGDNEELGRELVLASKANQSARDLNGQSDLGTVRNPIPIQRSTARATSPSSSASDGISINNDNTQQQARQSTMQLPVPTIPDHIIIRSPISAPGTSNNHQRMGSGSGPDRSRTPGPRRAAIPIAPSFDVDRPSSGTSSSITTAAEMDPDRRDAGGERDRAHRSRLMSTERNQTWTTQHDTGDADVRYQRSRTLSRSRNDDNTGDVLGLSGMNTSLREIGANEARERAREEERQRRELQFRERAGSPSTSSDSTIRTGDGAHPYTRPRFGSVSPGSSDGGNRDHGQLRVRAGGTGPRIPFPNSSQNHSHITVNTPFHRRGLQENPNTIPIAASTTQSQPIERAQSPSSSAGSTSPRTLRRMSHLNNINTYQHQPEGNRWSSTTGTTSTMPQILIEPPSRSESGETIHTISNMNPHTTVIQIPASEREYDYNLLSPDHAYQPLPHDRQVAGYGHGNNVWQIPVSGPASSDMQPIVILPSSGTPSPNMSINSELRANDEYNATGLSTPTGIPLSNIQHELPPGFMPTTTMFNSQISVPRSVLSNSQLISPDSRAGTPGNQTRTRTQMEDGRPLSVPRGPRQNSDRVNGRPVIPIAPSADESDRTHNMIGDDDEDEISTPRLTRTATPPRVQENGRLQPILSPIPISISDRGSDISENDRLPVAPNDTATKTRNSRGRREGGDYFSINHHQPRSLSRFIDPPAIRAFS